MGYKIQYMATYEGHTTSEGIQKKLTGTSLFLTDRPIRTGMQYNKVVKQLTDIFKKQDNLIVKDLHITNLQMLSSGRKIRRR